MIVKPLKNVEYCFYRDDGLPEVECSDDAVFLSEGQEGAVQQNSYIGAFMIKQGLSKTSSDRETGGGTLPVSDTAKILISESGALDFKVNRGLLYARKHEGARSKMGTHVEYFALYCEKMTPIDHKWVRLDMATEKDPVHIFGEYQYLFSIKSDC